jgi:prepilin peptidase CpaA
LPTTFSPALPVLAVALAVASVIDLRTGRIPNPLTATLAGTGLVLAVGGWSGISLAAACAGLVLGLVLMLPGHLLGATGAGDVKLMAAVGAVVGPVAVVSAFIATAIAGGVLAVFVAVRRGRLRSTVVASGQLVTAPGATRRAVEAAGRGNRFAYGPAIAVGTLIAILMR